VGGGLATATFFTLWVVPLADTVVDVLWIAVRRGLGGGVRRPGARGALPAPPVASLATHASDPRAG
jgi:hypothetical protein